MRSIRISSTHNMGVLGRAITTLTNRHCDLNAYNYVPHAKPLCDVSDADFRWRYLMHGSFHDVCWWEDLCERTSHELWSVHARRSTAHVLFLKHLHVSCQTVSHSSRRRLKQFQAASDSVANSCKQPQRVLWSCLRLSETLTGAV